MPTNLPYDHGKSLQIGEFQSVVLYPFKKRTTLTVRSLQFVSPRSGTNFHPGNVGHPRDIRQNISQGDQNQFHMTITCKMVLKDLLKAISKTWPILD